MLAKQSWRLILFPNSLVAKVLKSVYFPNSTFLDVSLGSSPSFVWKSLLWGRDLVNLGSRWRIGSGASTFVYKDRWLPRQSSFKVLSSVVLDPNIKVADLKSPSGGWDSNLVWSSFLPDDASLILNLPCSSTLHPDSLMWHSDRAGKYTVKSGYWVAFDKKLQASGPSCSNLNGGSWWRILWNLNLPSKVRLFCWRACHNWLPSLHTLQVRHLQVQGGCKCCGSKLETTSHALWLCPSLKEVRKHSSRPSSLGSRLNYL
ncbi:hypothetical protein ACOSQ4_017592 [Xanthoceras sorbifolium]